VWGDENKIAKKGLQTGHKRVGRTSSHRVKKSSGREISGRIKRRGGRENTLRHDTGGRKPGTGGVKNQGGTNSQGPGEKHLPEKTWGGGGRVRIRWTNFPHLMGKTEKGLQSRTEIEEGVEGECGPQRGCRNWWMTRAN